MPLSPQHRPLVQSISLEHSNKKALHFRTKYFTTTVAKINHTKYYIILLVI
jgi:hypothetical protein